MLSVRDGKEPKIFESVLFGFRVAYFKNYRFFFRFQSRLRNDLYCVEWDVKLYYTISFGSSSVNVGLGFVSVLDKTWVLVRFVLSVFGLSFPSLVVTSRK